jgi:hypothetical protein
MSKPRFMKWRLGSDSKTTYTCSNCGWKLELVATKDFEPQRASLSDVMRGLEVLLRSRTPLCWWSLMNLKYPTWQKPLADAILEFNPQQLREKLKSAEDAIVSRMQELRSIENSAHELRLLSDGLSVLRGVRRDRLETEKSESLNTGKNMSRLDD